MPGVVGIYAAEHLEALVPPVRATSRMRNYHATPIYPLARGKVRYVGEPIVAVLAESRYLAEDAFDPIEIAYEPLTPVVDPELAILQDATLLHEEAGTNVLAQREFGRGDIANASRKPDASRWLAGISPASGEVAITVFRAAGPADTIAILVSNIIGSGHFRSE